MSVTLAVNMPINKAITGAITDMSLTFHASLPRKIQDAVMRVEKSVTIIQSDPKYAIRYPPTKAVVVALVWRTLMGAVPL
jgi:hypothetical protein